jgi:hypothetical protein
VSSTASLILGEFSRSRQRFLVSNANSDDFASYNSVDFSPDAWQRDVLDKIDADESMLIVAPTSSGKTFISFAAMERVLRESDEGVGESVQFYVPVCAKANLRSSLPSRLRRSFEGLGQSSRCRMFRSFLERSCWSISLGRTHW